MKCGANIKNLIARGHNWRFYHENFPFLRQTPTATLPWGTIHWEQWFRSQSTANKQPTPTNAGKPGSSLRIPGGFCFNFACAVVFPGRTFLFRLLDLTTGVRKPHF